MTDQAGSHVRSLSRSARVGVACGTGVLNALVATLRLSVRDPAGVLALARERPLIFCFWHNRMLLAPPFYEKHLAPRPGVVLTSPSRDGAYLDEVARHFRLRAVRGSSSKRGMRAMFELLEALEKGAHLGITPDGPRGPKYRCGPGAILVAQKSGAPIAPLHFDFTRAWRLKSWDEFRIPKPFSRVTITLGDVLRIPASLDDAAFEEERLRLETVLGAGVAPE